MSNTIQHFTHNHPLTEVNGVGTYTCNGCKLYGDGKTYRCKDCNYDLHEYCATCPRSLINSCHGLDHELTLYSGPTHMTERSCYVCRLYIQGMFYKCNHCYFESHPLCTHVPMHASSPNAPVTKQRSLHEHAGQPTSPHHYGQGPPYGYAHMGQQPGPYPHVGGHNPYMNLGSPKAESNSSSSTPKTKKKKNGFFGAIKAVAAVTVTVATQLAVGTIVEGELLNEYN